MGHRTRRRTKETRPSTAELDRDLLLTQRRKKQEVAEAYKVLKGHSIEVHEEWVAFKAHVEALTELLIDRDVITAPELNISRFTKILETFDHLLAEKTAPTGEEGQNQPEVAS